jgi:preprotein translocase subunit SecE
VAKKASKSTSAKSDNNVVRIKAGSSTPTKPAKSSTTPAPNAVATDAPKKEAKAPKAKRERKGIATPFKAFGGYFKGAWVELRQVRWPTRRATWSFTGAVLIYTAFFVVFVLLLDALFKYLFEIILGN